MNKWFKSFTNVVLSAGLVATIGGSLTAQAASTDANAFTIYSNKSETQEALTNYAASWGEANEVDVTVKVCSGACSLGDQLKADFTAGEGPDVFVIEGQSGYDLWADMLQPISGEWVEQTEFEFLQNEEVYGFPVSVEGYGLAYNADLLEEAGIDPETLTSFEALEAAFTDLDARKDELGLISVVANATAEGETWIMGNHDFNAFLGNGLPNGDRTITEQVVAGETDADRMAGYADWVELLFTYTEPQMLTIGTQDDMDIAFASGQTAFLHQGNWKDPNLAELEADFNMGFIPYQTSREEDSDGLFIGAPSYYVVNKDTGASDSINKFFEDMVATPEGQNYMVNEANMISAFTTTEETPAAPLSAFLAEWISAEKPVYSFDSTYFMPDGYGMNNLGPIYGQFAQGNIEKEQFIELMTAEIAKVPELLGN